MSLRSLSWSFLVVGVLLGGSARAETIVTRQRLASASFLTSTDSTGCQFFTLASLDRVTVVVDGVMQPSQQSQGLTIQKSCTNPALDDFWALDSQDNPAAQQFTGAVTGDLRLGYMVGVGTVIGSSTGFPVSVALGWRGIGNLDDVRGSEEDPEAGIYVTSHTQTRSALAAGVITFQGRNLAQGLALNPDTYLSRTAQVLTSEPPPAECPLF